VLSMLPNSVRNWCFTRLIIENLDRNRLNEANPQLTPLLSEKANRCLEEHLEGIFQATCVADNSATNFQYLAMSRASGYTWKEISAELGMTISMLSGFYKRSLTKFVQRIREYYRDRAIARRKRIMTQTKHKSLAFSAPL